MKIHMSEYSIRDIQSQDIDEIASIHKASFSDRALTQLGIGAISRYYAWLLSGFPDTHPICVVTDHDEIAGFCFAGHYSGSFSGFLRTHKKYLVLSLIKRPWKFFNPVVREQVLLAIRTIKNMMKSQKTTLVKPPIPNVSQHKPTIQSSWGILSIAVNPVFQKQGVGRILMEAVENHASSIGYSRLHLSVHPENKTAVDFYKRLGWGEQTHVGTWQGLMEKRIK